MHSAIETDQMVPNDNGIQLLNELCNKAPQREVGAQTWQLCFGHRLRYPPSEEVNPKNHSLSEFPEATHWICRLCPDDKPLQRSFKGSYNMINKTPDYEQIWGASQMQQVIKQNGCILYGKWMHMCQSHISTNTQIMKNYAGLKSSTRIMKMDDIIFFQQHSVF